MDSSWAASQQAFADAAAWFVHTVSLVGDRWEQPGLGEWDVRALTGHTSRALLTVEAYLARPADVAALASSVEYYGAVGTAGSDREVAARGREAGTALGAEPGSAVARITARVVPLVEECAGTELLTTIAGGMRLLDYLPTRTFELVVHTADLCRALGLPPRVPLTAAAQALLLVSELAVARDLAAPILLAATGRQGFPAGFSVI